MKKFISFLVSKLYERDHRAGLLRFAQAEYPKDWQYAYNMMLQGQQPKA